MATAVLKATVGQALTADGGKYSTSVGRLGGADYTTVAANIATLVADGASPTQGHVTTLNTNWAILKGLIDGQTGANATLLIDLSQVTKMNQVRSILRAFERALEGAGLTA